MSPHVARIFLENCKLPRRPGPGDREGRGRSREIRGQISKCFVVFGWKQSILRPDSDSSCPSHMDFSPNHVKRFVFDPDTVRNAIFVINESWRRPLVSGTDYIVMFCFEWNQREYGGILGNLGYPWGALGSLGESWRPLVSLGKPWGAPGGSRRK